MEDAPNKREQLVRVPGRGVGLVPPEPRATLLVVLGEDEHDRLAATALADEAVPMTVCGGTRYRNSGHPELVVE